MYFYPFASLVPAHPIMAVSIASRTFFQGLTVAALARSSCAPSVFHGRMYPASLFSPSHVQVLRTPLYSVHGCTILYTNRMNHVCHVSNDISPFRRACDACCPHSGLVSRYRLSQNSSLHI
ncbi:hypothetical protein K466DRAFT_99895 [Polyporus arcularius HHB13444]|uniref:Uncharacterized protein n=1 Tax=Polyporus arcularius HHB13444 TaxID=1314778 RepID=A0A5C3PVN7_9APHY|nr:hypothetical protein K466DRAFT_99895 [Polyporus arcularius HHB13444]